MKRFKKLLVAGLTGTSVFGAVAGVSLAATDFSKENVAWAAQEADKTTDTDEGTDTKTKTVKIKIEGETVEVSATGNEWVKVNGYYHFVKDGKLVKGWKQLTKADGEAINHMSYFDKNGRLYTGWHKMGKAEGEKVEHWSYFGDNGWLRTGWQEMGNKANPDGSNKKHMSYFGADGWLRTGWQSMGKGTANSFNENSGKHWSYFGADGWLRTGWQSMGTKDNPDGSNKKHMSYFGANGWLRTGWQSMGKGTANTFNENSSKHWSYFGGDGWLRTGWQSMGKGTANSFNENSNSHWSYFGGNGWLATGRTTVNNVHCTFGVNGWLNKTEMDVYEYVDQNKDGYYQGCAGASLLMALKMKGQARNYTYIQFMDTMPYTNDKNPNHGYNGNPKARSGYMNSIYPPAIAKWGQRFGNVSDISGCNSNRLVEEVRQGNIPVVLVVYRYEYRGVDTSPSWGTYLLAHHFNTLVGYDYVNDRYKVADPNWRGDGQGGTRWIDGKLFRNIWNIQKGVVLVK